MSLHIPEDCNKIHLLFSGGADSTILLYLLLLEQQKNPKLEIKCYGLNIVKNGVVFSRSMAILNVMENRFNNKIPFHTLNKKYILRNFVELILSVDSGYVFSGCNKVLDFLKPTIYIPGDTPPFRGEPFNKFHIRPFIEMDKAEILSYYVKHDILDILDMTYSCGANLKIPCDNCYFCLEREWGLKTCGITA